MKTGGSFPARYLPKLGWSLVLFDEMGRVFHFAIPKTWVRRALIWASVGLLATIAIFARYVYVESQMQRIADKRRMLEEVRALQEQLRSAYQTEAELRQKLDELSARLNMQEGGNKSSSGKKTSVRPDHQPTSRSAPGLGGGIPQDDALWPESSPASAPPALNEIFLEQARKGVTRWQFRWTRLKSRLQGLEAEVRRREELLMTIPSGSPLLRPTEITSPFGGRPSPFEVGTSEFHGGVDMRAEAGDPVLATANGIVVEAGWTAGLGRTIKILHPSGFSTVYGHLQVLLVREGFRVRKGELIARAGSSGRSTGPHLHYEIHYRQKRVNPVPFITLTIEQVENLLNKVQR